MKKSLPWIALFLITACNQSPVPREMSALEVMGQINNDFCLLVDIREKGSFTKTAAPSIWIPFTDIEKNQHDLPKLLPSNIQDKTVVIFSDNPDLSIKACQLLMKTKYKCNYLKSFSDWENNNLPTRPVTF
ncbi:MAG: hypothetical protein A2381_14375 [Bdellovibrionales bacterium RIFOXYB1_FULL_37_110]|nr:MAG: hypothetical protein A2417_07145 [Bdellovibrionales bacterium RIFOXYC1_FULL_37_79]OFZ57528.1 MAG: hypothetical protein A2381_14375 [Bdellovibrionales bacterium RIFOXYB1_FULL_37_110]OFZ62999.1 MAG: hypothetical protein A2577_07655 [Bdellovibrionales bacterium RIFOXYD1_FULL_36_51]